MCAAALFGLAGIGQAQNASDFGAAAPALGTYDISQLVGGSDLGGTYYVDSGNPGQTFTTGTSRPAYPLTSVYIQSRSTGGSGSPIAANIYTLRVYSMTNASAGTATLLTSYVTTNSTTLVQGDWIRISGLTNILQPGTNYGFALARNTTGYWEPNNSAANPYAGGIAARFPTATAALNTAFAGSDMTFVLGLSLTVGTTAFNPISPVYVGTQVTLSAPITGGAAPFTYDWQVSTDGGVTFSDLGAGNGSPTYSLNTTGQGGTTYSYRLIVTDGEATPLITTNTAAALFVSSTPIPPTILSNTTITPPVIYLGGSSTISATFNGTPPIAYQWQYSATNDGTGLVNVSGATNTTFVLTNAQYYNAGYFRLTATNATAGTNSSFASLAVLKPMVITDFGATDPVPGANDIAQLSAAGNVGSPGGMNYYSDNGTPPGQTFITGSSVGGYSLASVYIKSGTVNGGHVAGNPWTLRLYSMTNSLTGTATLIGTYTNNNNAPAIGLGTWIKWFGTFTNVLSPNTAYGYSIRGRSVSGAGAGFLQMGNASGTPYPNGRAGLFPVATGLINASNAAINDIDGTFLISMVPAGYPAVQDVSLSPTNTTTFAGAPVTLNVAAIGANIGYIWQTDNGTGGAVFSDLPSSNTNLYNLNTSAFTPNTYQFRVLVTNSFGTNISSVLTLTVQAAVIQTVSIAPVNNSSNNPVYAGTLVTLSSTVQGNGLTYYWQTDGGLGGGFSNIPSSNTNAFTFDTSAMSAGTYLYQLVVSNASGTVTSSQLTLNLVAASGPVLVTGTTYTPSAVVIVGNTVTANGSFKGSQPITYQWQHAGTNIPSATNISYTIATAQFTDAGTYTLVASNNPPGVGPTTANSTAALLFVVPAAQTNNANAVFADGGASPYVGSYDIAQLLDENGTLPSRGGAAGTINYYVNAVPSPGQTFTTSNAPPTAAGYPLNYVYLKNDSTGTGTGAGTPQGYNLRVYQMLDGTNAQLLTSYFTTNVATFTVGDWVRVGGLTNILKTNTTYAFALQSTNGSFWKVAAHVSAGDDYSGGQSVLLPALSGAATLSYPDINFGFYYDAAFVAGMTPPTIPVVLTDTTISPAACLVGLPVTMGAVFTGLQPISYKWQHEGTNIPNATNATYTIAAAQFGDAGSYLLTATNSLGGAVSSPVSLTVNPYPQSFVINYAFTYGAVPATLYNGPGVIGAGTYWNQINAGGTSVSGYADDGTTAPNIKFNSTVPNQFNNTGAGDIGLLRYYMYGGNGAATPYTFSLTNLVSGVYNLVLFGCNGGNFHDSGTGFSVNGQTNVATCSTANSFVNNNNYVVFYNIAVTNGIINASWWKTGGREAAFNGAQLQMAFSYASPGLVIAQQPASRTNLTGTVASFSVLAEAPGSLFYQWRSNSVPISGATNSSYSAYTGTPGVWSYDVIVSTNLSSGTPVTSDTATLTVIEPNHLVWRGYTADWDLVSGNWSNLVTLADNVVFGATDGVLLDDSAASFTATISGALTPSSVTVNDAANNYVFNGTGSLSGSMGLTKTANGTLTISNNNSYIGGTIVNGGTLALAIGGANGTISGTLTINAAGTVNLLAVDALGYAGNFVTTANIAGGILNNSVGGNNAFATRFNLTGGTMSSSGGGAYNFDGAGSASVNSLASSTVSTISGPVTLRSSPLVISTAQGTVSSGIDLNVSGAIGGGGNDITKTGAGTLALSGVNTYSGLTTISNGRLLVNGTVPGVVTVNSGATLGGSGTIGGVATIQAGGTLAPGASIGTLTFNSSPALAGTVVAEINRNGGTPLADRIAVVGNPITYGGSLVVSNVGAALQAGDTFTLFTATGYSGAFTSTNLPSLSSGLFYSFANGVLSVLANVNTNPTNITSSVSGNQLTLSWPADHIGWRLQVQTNAISIGLRSNWVDVAGSTSVNTMTFTLDPANGSVFYRMVYP